MPRHKSVLVGQPMLRSCTAGCELDSGQGTTAVLAKSRMLMEVSSTGRQRHRGCSPTAVRHAGFAVTEPGVMTTAKDGTMKMQERMLVELAGMGPKVAANPAPSYSVPA